MKGGTFLIVPFYVNSKVDRFMIFRKYLIMNDAGVQLGTGPSITFKKRALTMRAHIALLFPIFALTLIAITLSTMQSKCARVNTRLICDHVVSC